MTVKEFFKSTAFKCIAVLLSILLVCGILLTICNSLFYVSAEEKFDRAVQKIYGKPVATEKVELTDDMTVSFSASSVSEAYLVEDGNYLIKSTGKQGFGGDVTCWVVVRMSEDGKSVLGAGNIAVDKAAGESYLSKIDSSELAQFSKIEYEDGFKYELGVGGKDYIKTGASYTMRAISNAVNGAIEFVNVSILGGAAATNPYEGKPHAAMIDPSTTYTVSGTEITYKIKTAANPPANPFEITIKVTDSSGTAIISGFTIDVNGSSNNYYKDKMTQQSFIGKTLEVIESNLALNDGTKDDVINTGATLSNVLCYEAAAFALANYSEFVSGGNAQ